MRLQDGVRQRAGVLDVRLAARQFVRDQPVVGLEDQDRVGRPVLLQILQDAGDALRGDQAVLQAELEKLAGELGGLFGVRGHRGADERRQTWASSRAADSL